MAIHYLYVFMALIVTSENRRGSRLSSLLLHLALNCLNISAYFLWLSRTNGDTKGRTRCRTTLSPMFHAKAENFTAARKNFAASQKNLTASQKCFTVWHDIRVLPLVRL